MSKSFKEITHSISQVNQESVFLQVLTFLWNGFHLFQNKYKQKKYWNFFHLLSHNCEYSLYAKYMAHLRKKRRNEGREERAEGSLRNLFMHHIKN